MNKNFIDSFKIPKNRILLKKIQLEQLRFFFCQQLPKSKFYSSQFAKHFENKFSSIEDLQDLENLEDLEKFPFTTKQDLLTSSFEDLLVEKNSIRCHATSGTTTRPLMMFYNQKDIQHWTLLTSRVLAAVGVKSGDRIQISFGYGLFTGGMGFHYGAESLGALVIPMGVGNTKKQIELMQKLKTNVLLATPSYANYLAEYIVSNNIQNLSLEKIICGGEPSSKKLRKNIMDKLQVNFYENYGLTEMYGPGVAFETEQVANENIYREQEYLYLNEDYFYPEIIDLKSQKKLSNGQEGELVLTSLQKDAMPIFRYRTGDITHIKKKEGLDLEIPFCLIAKPKFRCDDMLIVKGVNFYPYQIENILTHYSAISPVYEIHLNHQNFKERIKIYLEVSSNLTESQKDKLQKEIFQAISLHVEFLFHAPNTLKRTEGKRKVVYDDR